MANNRQDIYELIEEGDLTPDLQLMSQVIGIENVVKLLKELQGCNFYIPKVTRLDNFIEKYIAQNRSKPAKIIARELGVTEMFLKKFYKRKN